MKTLPTLNYPGGKPAFENTLPRDVLWKQRLGLAQKILSRLF